ncbi:hypothetical protein QOZ80_1AG0000470 [Eleusine coracana subsp. coracana]|nr:hypothetical protein QOZ80_1AG0000470 [Eleusine coracana subsp. coracana]
MDAHNIDDYFQENILSLQGQSEILTAVDLKIAFGVEKLLNLETLFMETARQAADIEPLLRDPQSISAQALHMAFEFDLLHTIVDSEVGELEKLSDSIHVDIQSVENNKVEEHNTRVETKLQAATESLNQMQELIATITRESATFDKVIRPSQGTGTTTGNGYENCHMSPQVTTQPEDITSALQMLQKSMASELDLDKELCDKMSVVEELKMKLYQAEHQSYFLEESMEAIYERMLSAENASQLFLGTSKDLIAKINTNRFNLSVSICREGGPNSKLKEGLSNDNMSSPAKIPADSGTDISKEALQMQIPSLPEFSTLRNKIQRLEEWLRDYGSQPQWSSLPRGADEENQNMMRSENITFRDIINELKVAVSKAESRTQNAEARCTQLTQTNDQLFAELNSNRASVLEKRLKESDTQLEHAKASVDAVVEQQSMLKSSMSDMEQVIEDLNEKFLKAETRAENAESKCQPAEKVN